MSRLSDIRLSDIRVGIHVLSYDDDYINHFPYDPNPLRWTVEFENGYGVSMIKSMASYYIYEIALFHNGKICYAHEVTHHDVYRFTELEELESILDTIAQFKRNEKCNHEIPIT